MDLIADETLLYPPFAQKIRVLKQRFFERVHYEAVTLETYRTPERQDRLHKNPMGIKAVAPWQSMHQYGLAEDIIFDMDLNKPGRQKPYDGDFKLLGKLAEELGLIWGGRFNDSTHIEWKTNMGHKEMFQLCKKAGQLEVWRHL